MLEQPPPLSWGYCPYKTVPSLPTQHFPFPFKATPALPYNTTITLHNVLYYQHPLPLVKRLLSVPPPSQPSFLSSYLQCLLKPLYEFTLPQSRQPWRQSVYRIHLART